MIRFTIFAAKAFSNVPVLYPEGPYDCFKVASKRWFT